MYYQKKKCVGQTFGRMGISGKRQFDLDIEFFKNFLYELKIDGAIFILSKFGATTMIFSYSPFKFTLRTNINGLQTKAQIIFNHYFVLKNWSF
jgi:hypothetical protein